MNATLLAPFAAHALARPSRTSHEESGVIRRWHARFVAAREREAAATVLRRLAERIPYARGAERARLEAMADDMRRRLR